MKLSVNISGLRQTVEQLELQAKQFRFGVAQGLNRTAARVRDAERAEMVDVFDRPTPFTLNSLFVKGARTATLEAVVGIKDNAGGARPAVSWLRWQVWGGLRSPTAFERLLMGKQAMRNDQRMVPGRFARRDSFGNISRGQLVQILSQLRIDSSSGSTRSLPRHSGADNAADTKRKAGVIRRAYARAGGQYVAFPNGRGKLIPGVYQVRQTSWGRSDPKPVLIFVSKAAYEPERFDFFYVARKVAERHLAADIAAAVNEQVRRGPAGSWSTP